MAPENPGNTSAGSDYTQGKYQTGLRTLALDDGGITNWAALQYVVAANLPHSPSFHKAAGIGDLSALLALAPIEIGNRVWINTDGDGLQDAGEPPLGGVTVGLYADGGTEPIATTITDAQGTYSFSNRPGVAPDPGAHKWGLAIAASTNYDVRVDNTADFTTGVSAGYTPTSKTNLPDSTDVDSNGVAADGHDAGGPGERRLGRQRRRDAGGRHGGPHVRLRVRRAGVRPDDHQEPRFERSVFAGQRRDLLAGGQEQRAHGAALSGLTVTDRLPAGLTFANPAASGPSWTCAPPAPADTVTCTWNGPDLTAGDTTDRDHGQHDRRCRRRRRGRVRQLRGRAAVAAAAQPGDDPGRHDERRLRERQQRADGRQPVEQRRLEVDQRHGHAATDDDAAHDDPADGAADHDADHCADHGAAARHRAAARGAGSRAAAELPVTGGNSNGLLLAALGLVLVGGLGYVLARRPRRRA